MAVIGSARTPDGKYRVYIHENHTAELCRVQGKSNHVVLKRQAISRITDWLAEQGYDELVPET